MVTWREHCMSSCIQGQISLSLTHHFGDWLVRVNWSPLFPCANQCSIHVACVGNCFLWKSRRFHGVSSGGLLLSPVLCSWDGLFKRRDSAEWAPGFLCSPVTWDRLGCFEHNSVGQDLGPSKIEQTPPPPPLTQRHTQVYCLCSCRAVGRCWISIALDRTWLTFGDRKIGFNGLCPHAAACLLSALIIL